MAATFEAVDPYHGNFREQLLKSLGQINLQLLEQVREGHIESGMKILEIECGYGQNVRFFVSNGYHIFGTDHSEEAIQLIKEYLPGWNHKSNLHNFVVADPYKLPFDEHSFDFLYSLHFSDLAKNPDQLYLLIQEALRVLKSSGILFLMLETNIGLDGKLLHIDGNRFLLPDGLERFLLSEKELSEIINKLNCKQLTPQVTILYQSKKSHTYLILTKN